MIERAAAARYEALVLTVDTAVLGRRERDVRRGFSLPPTHRARHARRRRAPPGLDVGLRPQRADPLRQRRRPRRRRRRLAGHAVRLHQHPVRPRAVVGRRRLAALGVGRPDRRSRASRPSTTPSSPPSAASTPSPCRTTAAASSTAPRHRSTSWRPSPTRSAGAPRSSATAASGGAATSSRPSPPAPTRAWPGGPTSTASAPPASGASTASSTGSHADLVRTMSLLGAGTVADLDRSLLDLS